MSKTLEITFLPEEIIDNIMVRVPVKSVGRFRSVSKSWRSLLSNLKFTRAHLNFHTHNEPEGSFLVEYDPNKYVFCTVNLANQSKMVSRKLRIPSSDGIFYAAFEGSCHGLVLFLLNSDESGLRLNLFNPITLETLRIPDSGYVHYGLSYDDLHDDYKIVAISYIIPQNVSIYSVKMKTWRKLGKVRYQSINGQGGWFVNGRLHWPASRVIVSFSLDSEKFEELQPPGFGERDCYYSSLIVLGGCLALKFWPTNSIEIWVMKEYGVQDSWTKFTVAYTDYYMKEVGVLRDEIVFVKEKDELVAYNWRIGVWRNMISACLKYNERRNFRESLISPNYG